MTYAVVATGGKQYKVVEGETLRVEKIAGEVGAEIVLDSVLLARIEDALKIGQPILEGAAVHATIVEQDKSKKVLVFKYKRRKRYRRMQGHRQPYTALRINRIEA
ncbi:LSU ribosomal protein L21P [Desulfobotulus alkaliphilus]|uniref:Large ribosomal subunit protein bL21 n=1 Tax=Desulfobotulus alkaliphilus TaxID=622671 RepID=A0A562R4E1_9BACT|nr:50S ribosomal protein L21 [Desulfobotulus alkaliphilus]TWI63917.1 LSU ribosomal protein L21P [Desulfobotulus alkaliphilus]